MMVDAYGPIDKLEDLEADDWESLREWVKKKMFIFFLCKCRLTFLLRKIYLQENIYLWVN